jgi:Holliday junction resolvasome RuvABC endonuclease subunit
MNNKQQQLYDNLTSKGYSITNIEDYKNMESILSITCKNGHRQTDTIINFQKDNWECIECLKTEAAKITSNTGFLLSLDAATNTTGWAIFNKKGQLINNGYFKADKKLPLMNRINQLLDEIDRLIKENNIKIIAIEDIQLEYNTIVFKTLAMLRGILFYHLEYQMEKKVYSFGADVWRSYSNIRGSNREEKKENTLIRAKKIYDRDFEEDEADAIFLGKYTYAQLDKPDEEVEELLNFGKEEKIEKIS